MAAFVTHPAALSFLAAVLVHLGSLPYAFVWDDHYLIEHNGLLGSSAGVARLLTADFWAGAGQHASGFWRPVVVASYAIEHRLGFGAPAMRLVNLLADAGASALLAALALAGGLPRAAAALTGLIFATLPAHLESVVWISGRTDVFAAAFGLAALLLQSRWRRTRSWTDEAAMLLALGAALLSKETAAPLFAVMAVSAWAAGAPAGLSIRGWVREWLPAAAVTAVYGLLHLRFAPGEALPAALVAATRARAAGGFWLLTPAYLAFLQPWYPHSPAAMLDLTHPPGGLAIAGGVALLLLAAIGLCVLVARRSPAALPWSLALATLSPVLAVNALRGTLLFAERFFYFPSAGVCWALAVHACALPLSGRRVAAVVATLALLAGIGFTLQRQPDWRDDETLFRSMTLLHPGNVTGYLQLARELDSMGRGEEAARAAATASRLDPERADVLAVRGLLALRAGNPAAALDFSNRAIAGGSIQLESRLTRAAALAALGRFEEARGALDTLRARMPGNPEVESLWGQYLLATGHAAEARPVLERGLSQFPDDADLAYALGMACVDTHAISESIPAFERAVEKRPGFYEAWLQLGAARLEMGDRAGAARALESAMRLPEAVDGRAAGLRRMVGNPR